MGDLRSPWVRRKHHHRLSLEKVTDGVLTGRRVYHFRCTDQGCRWPIWCYKKEFWT